MELEDNLLETERENAMNTGNECVGMEEWRERVVHLVEWRLEDRLIRRRAEPRSSTLWLVLCCCLVL